MAFSIQTNVNSLIAQENLRVNSNFQSQTIQRLTSGYRINQSGDDAAGLAIANKFRSDVAELTQGVRNANDGVSQLQIIDGGMSNIGKMLDRLKTLATQSASSTFTGDRTVLNKEYQTLVGEIDRQAQGVGLSSGGHFATSLGVFIGGGQTAGGAANTANGSVTLDLGGSAVDTKALGLRSSSFQVASSTGTDLGSASLTSVASVVTDTNNAAADSGVAKFNLSGPSFSGVSVSVNLSGVTDTTTMVNRLNDAIKVAANAGTASANALKNAGVTASVVTDTTGAQRLAFSSNTAAFQVGAADKTANALLGNFKTAGQPEGASVASVVTGGALSDTAGATVTLKVIANGTTEQTLAGIDISGDGAAKLVAINAALTGAGYDIRATKDSNSNIVFTGSAGETFKIAASGDTGNVVGLGRWTGGFASTTPLITGGDISAVVGSNKSAVYSFSVNGGDAIQVNVDATSIATVKSSLDSAIASNATLKAAGLTATINPGVGINIAAGNAGVRLNLVSGTSLQLSGAGETADTSAAGVNGFSANAHSIDASSTSATGVGTNNDVFAFAGMRNAGDSQEINVSLTDAGGSQHAMAVTLTKTNAGDIDKAISSLNTALQNDPNMKHIVAVKELNKAGTAEGIRFVSSDTSFNVKIGAATNYTTANPVGLYDGTAGAANPQGLSFDSSQSGTLDISSKDGGQQAVIAIGQAVGKLGTAQAAIGKGQNQLGYAISLANSQISNFSSAQAQIRDADVAMEAANLSKAQVLQQASIAAMAQANSAPQAVLSLLRG